MQECTYSYNGKEVTIPSINTDIHPQDVFEDEIVSKLEEVNEFSDQEIKEICQLDSEIFMNNFKVVAGIEGI